MKNRPFRLGLTGAIGMGKSTTARMFSDEGAAVWDADEAVHRLYSEKGAATELIAQLKPEVMSDGAVDRTALRACIAREPDLLSEIEAIVHPLVQEDRRAFESDAKAGVLVFDIPLLFETASEGDFDAVAVVTTSPEIQKDRVLSRGTMAPEQFETILARQIPDSEKRARADYVIDTTTMDSARRRVKEVMAAIRKEIDA